MNRESQTTLYLAEQGMMNNENICIDIYKSTIICICKDCNEKRDKEIKNMIDELINSN